MGEPRATVGPCCLINRDFKRQCRISMVLQGSAKGQAKGVEEKGGEEDRYLWTLEKTLCWHLNLLGSSWRANAAVFHHTTTGMKGSNNNLPMHHCMKLQLFWSTCRFQKWRKNIQLRWRKSKSTKSKDKRLRKTAQTNDTGQRRY